MGSVAEVQNAELVPPRRGAILAIAVDSTARPYDLSALELGGQTPDADLRQRHEVFLWLQAETNDVYFHTSPTTQSDLDNTAKMSAGDPVAFATTYGAVLKAGNPPVRMRFDRRVDRWLVLKAASTAGVLRIWAASLSS